MTRSRSDIAYEWPTPYDVIVVGAGHAGCEAALAAARSGARTLAVAGDLSRIAHMPCNPSIGGLGKGHLVREIDALGGEMGRNADFTGIHFRRLNASKGPAVQGTRCQSDKSRYSMRMTRVLHEQSGLDVKQGFVEALLVESGRVTGVVTRAGVAYRAGAVVLTTGTFLRGLMHTGLKAVPGGRSGEAPAVGLSASLAELGFELIRLKTGTCPRIDAFSIDWDQMAEQVPDDPPPTFSFDQIAPPLRQVSCHLAWTTEATHDIIRNNLDRSPMYSGVIEAVGPRYCPSIEDKVVRFADKPRHQIFLEPEGLDTHEIYTGGMSTSLPVDVQLAMLRTIRGLENVEIMRPGYAVEYDAVLPTQLRHSLETRAVTGLFLAGQINGTSGYEEAGAQGIVAGINAARQTRGEAPVVFDRAQAYIGVMIDDLVTRGVTEPYRMFTSRAEYRLLLREDNADLRLRAVGHEVGLVDDVTAEATARKARDIEALRERLGSAGPSASAANPVLAEIDSPPIKGGATFEELLRRPEIDVPLLGRIDGAFADIDTDVATQTEIQVKYHGYIERERAAASRMRELEHVRIPEDFVFSNRPGLSNEVVQLLERARPETLGHASRLPGMTPAAIGILGVLVRKHAA